MPRHKPKVRPSCEVEECDTASVREMIDGPLPGHYCHKHYSRTRRHGCPDTLRRATSNPGKTPEFKAEFVRRYKLLCGCADCGYRGHTAALDFDHRPGTVKVRNIKSGQQLGWIALKAEIRRCEVVCANCHRIRTFLRRGGDVT